MFKSIRARLIILTILAMLPAITFIFYLNSNDKQTKEQAQIANLRSIASLYSAEHAQIVDNTKHLLTALAATPQITSANPAECNNFLRSLITKYQRYSNFGVADRNGNIICSAVDTAQPLNISNTLFFSQTIQTQDFSIGEYRISQATNNAVLSFGYPLPNGVIYSSIDLSWLNRLTQDISLDKSINTLILDKNGVVLTQTSIANSWVGKSFPQGAFLDSIRHSPEGVEESIDLDGINRIYAFKKIADLESAPFVAVGISKESIFSQTQTDFANRLLASIIIGGISIIFSWWAGSILIIKQVKAMNQIDKMKDDFISLVSHQIRTPLTSIRWFSEILLSEGSATNKQKNLLRDIHSSTTRVISLVGTLLDISKLESGKIHTSRQKTNLEYLTTQVLKDLTKQIKTKKTKVKIDITKKAKYANLDPKLIKQVYLNLIGNAIKYSPDKSQVYIKIYRKDNFIISEIKDQGIGIPDIEKSKIFQKFSRAENAVIFSPDGSGLGLYLAKLIVEAHDGNVWFRSLKHRGSVFGFTIAV